MLHRVVEVREHDYVILGDNCLNKEYGIRDEDIIGVLTAFVRNGKTIRMESRGQMLYARIWYTDRAHEAPRQKDPAGAASLQ